MTYDLRPMTLCYMTYDFMTDAQYQIMIHGSAQFNRVINQKPKRHPHVHCKCLIHKNNSQQENYN